MTSVGTPRPRSRLTFTSSAGNSDATRKWIAERGETWVVSGQARNGKETVAYETTEANAGHLAASMLERGFFGVQIHPPTG